jgi:hypothetical protein
MAEEFPFTTLHNGSDITIFAPSYQRASKYLTKQSTKRGKKSFLPSSSSRAREGGNEWAYQTPKHEEED